MPQPFEIIAGPIEAWIADVGADFPLVDEEPDDTDWLRLGASGALNITEDGVRVAQEESLEFFRGLGSTGPVKGFRTSEDLRIEFSLADVRPEIFAFAAGRALADIEEVVAGAATPGFRALQLFKGFTVQQHALLLRQAQSPEGDDMSLQWEIPRVTASAYGELTYVKGTPVAISFSFNAMWTEDTGFGRYVVQSDPRTA